MIYKEESILSIPTSNFHASKINKLNESYLVPQGFIIEKQKENINLRYPIKNSLFENITPNASIANGDCEELMKDIEDNSIDLIITDPPYNLGSFMHKRNTNLIKMRENQFAYSGWDEMPFEEWIQKMDVFFKESNRVLKKRCGMILFMSLMKIESIIRLAEKNKFYYKTVGVWHKTNPMPRNMNLQFVNSTEAWIYLINEGTTGTFNNESKVIHDFVESSLTSQKEKRFGKHPTQKPLSIINHFTKILSNPSDFVCDPFMGSGSTGVSCEMLNRNFIGIELNNGYYEIAKKKN